MQLLGFFSERKKVVFSLLWLINCSWISVRSGALFPQPPLSKICIHFSTTRKYFCSLDNPSNRQCTAGLVQVCHPQVKFVIEGFTPASFPSLHPNSVRLTSSLHRYLLLNCTVFPELGDWLIMHAQYCGHQSRNEVTEKCYQAW